MRRRDIGLPRELCLWVGEWVSEMASVVQRLTEFLNMDKGFTRFQDTRHLSRTRLFRVVNLVQVYHLVIRPETRRDGRVRDGTRGVMMDS